MATLFLRDGYYYIRYYDGAAGYTKRISTGFPNTREGKALAHKKLREFEAKQFLNPLDLALNGFKKKRQGQAIKISEGYELFKKEHEENDDNLSEKTLEAYDNALLKLYDATGDAFIHMVTPEVNKSLKAVFDRDESKGNTRSIYTRSLHSLFQFFVKKGYIRDNPIKALPIIKIKPRSVSLEDVRKMLNYLKEREQYYIKSDRSKSFHQAYNLVKFLVLSGFRISEADALRWEDIDMSKRLILTVHNIKENREDEYFPIHQELYEHLLQMNPQEEGKVFDVFSNKRSVRRIWSTMMDKLNMDYTIHQLRKTTSTVLTSGQVSHFAVQKFIRHKSFQTTMDSYAEAMANEIRQEIEKKTKFNL